MTALTWMSGDNHWESVLVFRHVSWGSVSGLKLGTQHLHPLGHLNQRLHHFEAPSLSSASLMTSLYKIHTCFVFYEIFSFFILALYIFMHKMFVLIAGSIFYSVGWQCCTQNLDPPAPSRPPRNWIWCKSKESFYCELEFGSSVHPTQQRWSRRDPSSSRAGLLLGVQHGWGRGGERSQGVCRVHSSKLRTGVPQGWGYLSWTDWLATAAI